MAQPYVGEIRMFAGNFAPDGWYFCRGQSVAIAQEEVLFQLIGTTYGGDGESTFNLPNLASRAPMHMGNGPDGVTYPIGQMAGTEAETITTQQLPVHTHALAATTNLGTDNAPAGNLLAQTSGGVMLYREVAPASAMDVQVVVPVGGSQPHDNTQPFLCINFIISRFGLFPSPT